MITPSRVVIETNNELAGGLFSPTDAYHFVSLGSGSSGNSYLVDYRGTRILLDAGLGPRTINLSLKRLGVSMESLSAIFITHDHADHMRAVGVLASRYFLPVYASVAVCNALLRSRFITENISASLRPLVVGDTVEIGAMRITSFEVPHDSTQNVGYLIESDAGVLGLVTDVGHLTEDIASAVARANYLIFESNYDPEMLAGGTYPPFLKSRISGGLGHLSNIQASDFMAKHYHLDLNFLALCHLSKENNHPDLAWKTMDNRLFKEGIRVGKDLELHSLKRSVVSEVFTLQRRK